MPFYGDPWMDNGLVNLHSILKDIPSCRTDLGDDGLTLSIEDKDDFIKELSKTIKARMNSIAFYYTKDKNTGEKRNIKKRHILIQYGSKVEGKNVLKEKILSDTENRVRQIFQEEMKGSKICVLCNREYSKKVDNLKQSVHPTATKIRSLSGVRQKREYYDNLCPLCYLIGSLEWLDKGLVYLNLPGKNEDSFAFLPVMKDLRILSEFKTYFVDQFTNPADPFSNLSPERGFVEGEYSVMLCFYEKFFERVWLKEEVENYDLASEKVEICTDWMRLKIPSGIVKNVKIFSLKIPKNILKSIYELAKDDKLVYSSFVHNLFFSSSRRAGGDLRENVARGMLEDDFRRFSSGLLPRKGGHVVFIKEAKNVLYRLIPLWRMEGMGLTDADLKDLKSVARIVGVVSLNHISILYKLDRARTPAEFLDALRELGRRLVGLDKNDRKRVYPPALTKLVDLVELRMTEQQKFENVKNILTVYSCVEFSMLNYRGKGGKKSED